MNYIDEIFERANIQRIREFLLNGYEESGISAMTCGQRMNTAESIMNQMLLGKFPDDEERSEVIVIHFSKGLPAKYRLHFGQGFLFINVGAVLLLYRENIDQLGYIVGII